MGKKLEFKQIAPYLPYGLKWTLQELGTFTMSGLTKETLYTEEGKVLNWDLSKSNLPQALFPILRPLSDYFKMGLSGFSKKDLDFMQAVSRGDTQNYGNISYLCILWLLEHHYDIYNLIPKGFAIDINSLNQ